ncbi:hypothetical protein DL95DRAFT_471349 [Leptodontidium sp. 2 PMI_412]|nr:hypothetical protein DL95DRAFT_471349 [Leptodontidium sp. 2 PMI_412]
MPGTTSQTKRTLYPAWTEYYHPAILAGEGTYASVQISSEEITIAAGSSATFSVTFQEPTGLNGTLLPVYGGSISINSTTGESFKVPYMGVYGSIYKMDIWEMEREYSVLPHMATVK